MQHQLTRLPRARRGEAGDQRLELRLRHRENHQFAAFDQVGHLEHGNPRQHRLGPIPTRLRDRADADDRVPRASERGTEHGADATGTHDPHPEAARGGAHVVAEPGRDSRQR